MLDTPISPFLSKMYLLNAREGGKEGSDPQHEKLLLHLSFTILLFLVTSGGTLGVKYGMLPE